MKGSNLKTLLALLIFGTQLGAQSPPVGASPAETAFVQYLLNSIANPDSDPKICALNEQAAVTLYGLNAAEARSLHAAGVSFASVLGEFRLQKASKLPTSVVLSVGDRQILAALSASLMSSYAELATSMLSSLRPERADYLRLQARLAADAASGKRGFIK